jgi:hypothetical protein
MSEIGSSLNYHSKVDISPKFIDDAKEREGREFLTGHEATEENRARMIDWMIQVFRVLKTSSP